MLPRWCEFHTSNYPVTARATHASMKMMKRTLILVALLFASAAFGAESIAGYEAHVLVTGGAKADDALPMIIGLHYSGATPDMIASDFDAIDFPARIVLPRGHHPRRDGFSWFPADYGKLSVAEQAKATLAVTDEISEFITAAVKRFATKGKPVIAGVSYGGDLSYLIAIHHPEQVAAAFPVAARCPAEWIPSSKTCDADCPPVIAMHGDKDAIISIESGRDAAKRLVARGYRVELREYDAVHDFSAAMKADFTAAVKRLLHP
jgi:phospholipase/carboxylesterase